MSKANGAEDRVKEFPTSTGRIVRLRAVSPFLLDSLPQAQEREWLEAGKTPPQPPTFIITTAAKTEETHLLDETTLDVPGDEAETTRRKKLWADYHTAQADWDAEMNLRAIEAFLFDGVQLDDGDGPDERWAARMKFLGIAVPEDELERTLLYVQNEVIRSADDFTGIVQGVMELSGVSQEMAAQAESSFRHPLEPQARPRRRNLTRRSRSR